MRTYVSKKSLIRRNKSFEGESVEDEIRRRMEGQEVEMGTKQLGYTLREDGVLPVTNIRTDKFAIAQEAHDYVSRSIIAKGVEFAKKGEGESEGEGKGESKGGTGPVTAGE